MTLKEKFFELAFAKISSGEGRDECVKIADEFAIGFAVWLQGQNLEFIDLSSVQQLLSNYKKEKRL